jgi:hypothetical protein
VPTVVAAVVLLTRGDEDRIGALGLVTAVSPLVGVCLAVLLIGYVVEVHRGGRRYVLGQILVGVIVILYGAPALVESEPRFATAYAHVGFVEYIVRTGHTLDGFDARFSWPGFFSAIATVLDLTGMPSALPLVPWAPVAMELLFLPPLLLIGRQLVADPRGRALGVLVFYLSNWVGQDYFAPQAVAFLLYLVALAILLTWFRPVGGGNGPDAPRGPLGRLGERLAGLPARTLRLFAPLPPDEPVGAGRLRALLLIVVLLVTAMTVSHQLTPFGLGVVVGVMVVFRVCRLRSLPVLIAVLVLSWLSFAATDFWLGHLKDVTGSVGDVSGNVTSNVGHRLQGSGVHRVVLALRLVLTAAVWSAALWAVLRPARRALTDPRLVLLAAAPFPVVALNSYGGEALLRVFLYSLPFMSFLAGSAVLRPGFRRRGVPRRWPVLAAAFVLAVGTLFPIVRYGNERFEMIRPGEFAALSYVYDHAPRGSTLLSLSGSLPWRYRDVERYAYDSALPYLYPVDLARLEARLRSDAEGSLLVVTQSQIYELEDNQGIGPDWAAEMSRRLHAAPNLYVVFESDSAFVVATAPSTALGRGGD